MNPIRIISASAGSGKTTQLAEDLDAEIAAGRVRPDGILATTFTRKAAAELEERARTRLLAAGRTEDAQRLAAARIGTVNAVAGRLVGEFAFELGLSPEIRVLDERAADEALRRALAEVVTPAENEELADLRRQMSDFDWTAAVREMIGLARVNLIDAAALEACGRRSLDGMGAFFGTPAASGAPLERALEDALERFLALVDLAADQTQATAAAVDTARAAFARLRSGRPLPWKDWVKLSNLETGAQSRAAAEPLRRAAVAHDAHPRLWAQVARAVELVFSIAGRALSAYQEHKRSRGALDFVDQEVLALGLLERPDVRERLAEELDLVLVDEFQDTSPLELAIFLKLAGLARRSVWVGDQKQAIYGFRGTDPALMDAAIDGILRDAEPVTLATSHRSRPELVRLTSDVFARAFAAQDPPLPESRVRLEPALDPEPPGLGPPVERWRLAGRNQSEEIAAVAAAARALLGDASVRVRDRTTGEPRALRPGDIAILCRRNETCLAVAQALEALDIRAAVPRRGLLSTPEAALALAALRHLVDPGDRLAMAEVARIAEFPADGDLWLQAAIAEPHAEAFAELPSIARLRAVRAARPELGALPALDEAIEGAGVRELCLAWGDAERRLANIDALRAHAAAYVEDCAVESASATSAGLVMHLESLGVEEEDARAVVVDESAIVLSTWHGAKGLEWPVTVLFELWTEPRANALGVHAVSDRKAIQLEDPLGGRWIRFWPNPFHPSQVRTPFHARLAQDPAAAQADAMEQRELLRLVYVAWTRARDRLVLAARAGRLTGGTLGVLRGRDGLLISEPGEHATWVGRSFDVQLRDATPQAPIPRTPRPGVGHEARGPVRHPPAFVAPSALEGRGLSANFEKIGEPIHVTGKPEWADLGDALHSFFAADGPALMDEERREIAAGLLARWGVADAIDPMAVLAASAGLRAWAGRRFPDATWRREWPIRQRTAGGTVVRGSVDLVLEAAAGLVVVDHKCIPTPQAAALESARDYAGQLEAYAEAIHAATGRVVVGRYIHLPLTGAMVEVRPVAAASGATRVGA